MRLLILLAIIIYILWRVLKPWLFPVAPPEKIAVSKAIAKIDDVMVKDLFCEVYFPQKNGVPLRVEGKDLYFCSTECRDNFIALCSEKDDQAKTSNS